MSLAENVGVVVKNMLPPSVELKIYYTLYIVHMLYYYFRFWAAILAIWLWNDIENSGMRVFLPPH